LLRGDRGAVEPREEKMQASFPDKCSFALDVCRLPIYDIIVLRSFRDAETEKIFQQQFSKKLHGVEKEPRFANSSS